LVLEEARRLPVRPVAQRDRGNDPVGDEEEARERGPDPARGVDADDEQERGLRERERDHRAAGGARRHAMARSPSRMAPDTATQVAPHRTYGVSPRPGRTRPTDAPCVSPGSVA